MPLHPMKLFPSGQRASSIKTRIKTIFAADIIFIHNAVREHLPLQQGLRQFYCRYFGTEHSSVREHLPLQQGLRPDVPLLPSVPEEVREHLPLQQGLRPIVVVVY